MTDAEHVHTYTTGPTSMGGTFQHCDQCGHLIIHDPDGTTTAMQYPPVSDEQDQPDPSTG